MGTRRSLDNDDVAWVIIARKNLHQNGQSKWKVPCQEKVT